MNSRHENEQDTKSRPRSRSQSQSLTSIIADKITAITLIALFLFALFLLAAFYFITWQALSAQSRAFIQAWALIATTLIILCGAGCLYIGFRYGLGQANMIMSGIDLTVPRIIHAAEQVAEVRVSTLGRYRGAMRERKGTQEWAMSGDIFGLMPPSEASRPASPNDIIDPNTIDMPASQTGRRGE